MDSKIKLIIAGAVAFIVVSLVGYIAHKALGKDNVIEQVSEKILKDEFSIDYDFSAKEKQQIQESVNDKQ